MKRICILFFILFLLTLSAQGQTAMDINIGSISISVPSGWIAHYTDSTMVFILYSPVEENDTFQENINVTTEKLPLKYSVQGYMSEAVKSLKTVYTDLQIIESKDNYHIFSGKVNNTLLKQMQFVYIKDNTAYVVTYTATPDSFDRYVKTFNEIQKTFKY